MEETLGKRVLITARRTDGETCFRETRRSPLSMKGLFNRQAMF